MQDDLRFGPQTDTVRFWESHGLDTSDPSRLTRCQRSDSLRVPKTQALVDGDHEIRSLQVSHLASEQFVSQSYDLVFTNLSFPGMDSLRDIRFFQVLNLFRRQLDLDTRNSLIDASLSVQSDNRVLAGVTQ